MNEQSAFFVFFSDPSYAGGSCIRDVDRSFYRRPSFLPVLQDESFPDNFFLSHHTIPIRKRNHYSYLPAFRLRPPRRHQPNVFLCFLMSGDEVWKSIFGSFFFALFDRLFRGVRCCSLRGERPIFFHETLLRRIFHES